MSSRTLRALTLCLAAGTLLAAGQAQDRSATGITPDRVARLVKQAKPKGPEAWTRIPWVASLAQARQLSQKENRPVFLFALLGNLARNRC